VYEGITNSNYYREEDLMPTPEVKKNVKDLTPFCVSTEGLTQEQVYKLFKKVGTLQLFRSSKYNNLKTTWFGVDSEGYIVNRSFIRSFDQQDKQKENVTVVPYEELDSYLGLTSVVEPIQEVLELNEPDSAAKEVNLSELVVSSNNTLFTLAEKNGWQINSVVVVSPSKESFVIKTEEDFQELLDSFETINKFKE
jgi:hypothetical protein